MNKFRALMMAATALLAAGCATTNSTKTTTTPATAAAQTPLFGPHGFDVTGLDRKTNACDDFYQFAVGKWRETNPLPAQFSRFGRFEELDQRNKQSLRTILEEDAAKADSAKGSPEQKLGDYYSACLNESGIESRGLTDIAPELDRITAIHDLESLRVEIAALHAQGFSPLFRLRAEQDFKNSKMIIAGLNQAGLGLPDRDYYLRDDERFRTIREQYVTHVGKMLQLAGESAAQSSSDAQKVLALETKLATAAMSRVEQRSPENVYHIVPLTELAAGAPNLNWTRYLEDVGVNVSSINVAQPAYFKEANRLLADVPLDDWKAYLHWSVIDSVASTLPRAFVEEDFNFRGKTLSGQKEELPRWNRCVRSTDGNLGDLLGNEYVRRHFTPQAKAKMNALIDNLVAALREDIPTLTWMGPQTKRAAIAKLDAFSRRIGYPDKWRDYSPLTISRDSYTQNLLAARRFSFRHATQRIGKPDDPNEWGFFTTPTVNASYDPSRNDITFPAGILQPPFYDPNADDAYNYGGIGTVIGHEMTHGFDDEGAKFDPQGNLRNWWTAEDLKNFEARAECVRTQYSEFNVAPGININGKLVSGEEIADLGGVTLALRAYERSQKGRPHEIVDGFTPEQRFFLGFAQVWGENMAAAEQTRRALTDPHAQGPFRVNGTVGNMPAFAKAFGCTEKSKMVREVAKRCAIW